jgi:hypothetical protein
MKETTLIRKYLRTASKPNFNGFSIINQNQTEDVSMNLSFKDALSLQRHWAKTYNKLANELRPGRLLAKT